VNSAADGSRTRKRVQIPVCPCVKSANRYLGGDGLAEVIVKDGGVLKRVIFPEGVTIRVEKGATVCIQEVELKSPSQVIGG